MSTAPSAALLALSTLAAAATAGYYLTKPDALIALVWLIKKAQQ